MWRNFLFEIEGFVNLTIYFIILLIFLLLYKLDVKGQIYPLSFTLVTYTGIYRSLSVFPIILHCMNSRYKGIHQIGVHCISNNFNYHIIFHLLLFCIYFDKTISCITKYTMYEIKNCAFLKKLKYLKKKMKH